MAIGRLTTARIAFDLPSLQGFGESCTIVQDINSEPESPIKRALLTFSSNSNRLAAISKGDFSTPGLRGYGERAGGELGDEPIR